MRSLEETPDLRWFDAFPKCRMCGKTSEGLLMDRCNASYGHHCSKCANKRLELSRKVRERLEKEQRDACFIHE